MEPAVRIRKLLDELIQNSRTLSAELSPRVLYTHGLASALHWLKDHKLKKYGLTLHVEADPADDPDGEDAQVLLFDLVRELLLNVVKHAGTDEAWVRLARPNPERLELVVEDRGHGFDPDAIDREGPGESGFGLSGMGDRLAAIGGTLTVDTAPGEGTRVTLSLHGPSG